MPSKSPSDYRPLSGSENPTVGEAVAFDVYVHLPRAGRYLRYICKGDVWEARKEEVIQKHSDPQLYREANDSPPDSDSLATDPEDNIPPISEEAPKPETPPEIQVFNDTVEKELEEIFRFVSNPTDVDAPKTIKAMEELSQKIIEVVAPDIEDLRSSIVNQSKYLMVMSDSAAITSVAVLIAMAHGFDSRKIFRDLSMAILLMDAPLADLPEEVVRKYYTDRSTLAPQEWEEMRRHPARAHEVISTRLKAIPDAVLQLVLNHHELYNSKGYPRQIRNETLPPITRSLSLAVDIFEIMKREHFRGKEIDILQALEELKESSTEAHLRRHNQKLIQSALKYLQEQSSPKSP